MSTWAPSLPFRREGQSPKIISVIYKELSSDTFQIRLPEGNEFLPKPPYRHRQKKVRIPHPLRKEEEVRRGVLQPTETTSFFFPLRQSVEVYIVKLCDRNENHTFLEEKERYHR
jgi:hypothetical protein